MPAVLQAIDAMSSEEKVRTMDYLWSSLESSSGDYQPPAWHARELVRREQLYAEGKIPVNDWEDAKARLDSRRAVLRHEARSLAHFGPQFD